MRSFVLALIRGYQLLLSPLLGPCCRFTPSCSHYAAACVQEHGVLRGIWLSIGRLLRCHPWHSGGVDLPPSKIAYKKPNMTPCLPSTSSIASTSESR